MQSYSYGSADAIAATVEANANTGEKFSLELNATDFETVLIALQQLSVSDPACLDELDVEDPSALMENAGDLMSSMAQVLGIEMI